jgi:histidine ammonia-lyase
LTPGNLKVGFRLLSLGVVTIGLLSTGLISAASAPAVAPYRAITPTLSDQTVMLSGKHLTVDEVVRVARFGAKVALTPEARQRSADAHGLLLEAAAEGMPIYWFNRGVGSSRENAIFTGDPTSAQNKALLEARQLAVFKRGALAGLGPEVDQEEIVRAMMVVRANTMSYEAASPQLTQRLLDLLNDRITPVVQSRGTVGEGDLGPFANIGAVMVGAGTAYYQGERMPAAQALERAGLAPLAPFGADDSELESTDSYAAGMAALLVHDAREALSWADLVYAVDLDGMNSSVSPLAQPVQANRPFKWLNWDAARILDMLRGSYLFDLDAQRIIQDPESLRASSIRQGSAWAAWAQLRDTLAIQMNSSDHNPSIRVGASPGDSWELSTPQLAQFYVKGGKLSHGQHGYILSDANWDPYPLANDLEAFSIAFANMDVAVSQRLLRFTNTFFTVISPPAATPGEPGRFGVTQGSEIGSGALMQEIQGLINPVPPQGSALIKNVEDLQTQTRLKVTRARTIVADTMDLLAEDLLTGTYWLDLRKQQDPSRNFGPAPTILWNTFRATLPFPDGGAARDRPIHDIAASFMREHPAASFIANDDREPDAGNRRYIEQ